MENIKLNEGLKKVLRTYSVPEDVISMIEEDSNVKVQTVADFYEKQIQDMGNKQEEIRKEQKEQSSVEFMKTLNKHRIIDK